MANVRIERCTVHGLGRGYKVVDNDTGNNFWHVLYASIDKAVRDCQDHTVVSVCERWPELRDNCGNVIGLDDPDYTEAFTAWLKGWEN